MGSEVQLNSDVVLLNVYVFELGLRLKFSNKDDICVPYKVKKAMLLKT